MAGTVGEVLSNARRSLGRSLQDAEAATKIRARMLEALERGDYDALPSPAYVRGYIISYARFLELDSKDLLAKYRDETGHTTTRESLRLPEQVVAPRSQQHAVPLRTALLIIAVIVVIAIALWGVGRLRSGPESTPPIPNAPEPTSTTTPEAMSAPGLATETVTPSTAATSTQDEVSEAAGEPFTVRVRIEEGAASWLRVTVDDMLAYEGTLNGGESREWDVEAKCTIRIGKPSAVVVFRDGNQVEIPASATIPEITLSADAP